MPTHGYEFKLAQLNEQGEFSGMASVYGVTDLANDVVMPGAFTKTLAASGKERPLLWQHGSPIGICSLTDTPSALMLTGKLSLELQSAKDAYVLLKAGIVKGLSIGFQTVKDEFVGGFRQLKEIKLWEVSLVTFPCLESAQVTGYKSASAAQVRHALSEFRRDILSALERF